MVTLTLARTSSPPVVYGFPGFAGAGDAPVVAAKPPASQDKGVDGSAFHEALQLLQGGPWPDPQGGVQVHGEGDLLEFWPQEFRLVL